MQRGTYKIILINKIKINSTVDPYQDLRKETMNSKLPKRTVSSENEQ